MFHVKHRGFLSGILKRKYNIMFHVKHNESICSVEDVKHYFSYTFIKRETLIN